MTVELAGISDDTPGVRPARQLRSVRIRDSYIAAGVAALNTAGFDDLSVSQLASASGNSVGSFYSRFNDKEAFFETLRAYAVEAIEREFVAGFTPAALRRAGPTRGLELLVDLLGDIFASRFRGVLRESLLRILEPDAPWAPMRRSAQRIIAILHKGLANEIPGCSTEDAKARLSFCFQLIVGVLQNDLVNDNHVFSLRDGTVRDGLKDAVCGYMRLSRDA